MEYLTAQNVGNLKRKILENKNLKSSKNLDLDLDIAMIYVKDLKYLAHLYVQPESLEISLLFTSHFQLETLL